MATRAVVVAEETVTVERVNGRGFKATDGTWYNVSKFAQVALPTAGQRVVVGLDKDGFVRTITPAPAETPEAAPAPVASLPERDRQIVRMNAIGHAVQIVMRNTPAGERIKLADVLACAERIEEWIARAG